MTNLPKDYIRTCLTYPSLAKLFNFIAYVSTLPDTEQSPGYRTNLPFSRTDNRISRIKATLNLCPTVMLNVSKCTLIKTIFFLTRSTRRFTSYFFRFSNLLPQSHPLKETKQTLSSFSRPYKRLSDWISVNQQIKNRFVFRILC